MDKKMMAMSTSMLILKLLEEEDLYGYLMIRRLEERSNQVFSLKEGTLYPILHTLEEQEAVESYEKAAETGRIRKYYRLTKKGQKLLKEKQKEWETYEKAVRNVMKGGVSFAL
jgi:PadR family transcriptional regulator PadR